MREDSVTTRSCCCGFFLSGNALSTFTCPLVLGTLNEDGSSNMTQSELIKIIGSSVIKEKQRNSFASPLPNLIEQHESFNTVELHN